MKALARPWVILAFVVLSGIAALFAVTRGFSALTSDRARQVMLDRTPISLPHLKLVDGAQAMTDLKDMTSQGRYTLISLVYMRCTTMCLVSASNGAFLQSRIRRHKLADRVQVLTLSFDPARDTPEVLREYGRRMRADPSVWRIATVAEARDLERMLHAFGLVVLPDGEGGYIHNGAIFVADGHGQLVKAFDPDAADDVLEFVAEEARP